MPHFVRKPRRLISISCNRSDREGEAISWHLSKALKLEDKDIYRITFNEITKTAVKAAIKDARKIDMNLVDAQQARRALDRVVGYSISLYSGLR